MAWNRIIPYNPKLRDLARSLRRNSTLSEILIWKKLKRRQLGFQFHRQVPLDQFIVDFYCHELMLAIEIDGSSHDSEQANKKDLIREDRLKKKGIKFLRFKDIHVKKELESVVKEILKWIEIEKGNKHPPSLAAFPPSMGE